jgi:hypothetical protein
MRFECHQCKSIVLDPCKPCANCGHLLEISLWTTANENSLNKHGLYKVSGSLEISVPPLGGTLPPNTSFFDPKIDLTSSFRYVLASGSAISPVDSLDHRLDSIYWFFGHTTGAGVFGGTPTYFQGIRVVNPNSPVYIHLFPDRPRPEVDQSLTCRRCSKVFPISSLPENCDSCGYRFWW